MTREGQLVGFSGPVADSHSTGCAHACQPQCHFTFLVTRWKGPPGCPAAPYASGPLNGSLPYQLSLPPQLYTPWPTLLASPQTKQKQQAGWLPQPPAIKSTSTPTCPLLVSFLPFVTME